MNWYKMAKQDYMGNHTAPVPMGNNSLDNLSDVYDDEIYSINGARYYGDRQPYDDQSLKVIRQAREKPDYLVEIYRAI
jgi:hypothetical protein